jgi:hypothetical protein
MTLQRRIGLGVTLGVDTSGGSNYAVLGNVVNSIKHGGTKAQQADISILSDTYMQFAKGQIDPGEWTFEIAFDPLDTNTSSKIDTMHAATGVNAYPFQIQLPAIVSPGTNTVAYSNFSAHVMGIGAQIEKDKLLIQPVTLKVTGDPHL